jgi:hypothetical protein
MAERRLKQTGPFVSLASSTTRLSGSPPRFYNAKSSPTAAPSKEPTGLSTSLLLPMRGGVASVRQRRQNSATTRSSVSDAVVTAAIIQSRTLFKMRCDALVGGARCTGGRQVHARLTDTNRTSRSMCRLYRGCKTRPCCR